jgi:hypothetical protein
MYSDFWENKKMDFMKKKGKNEYAVDVQSIYIRVIRRALISN